MPTVAVYLKAIRHRALEARGLDVDVWVRAAVSDAIAAELDGEVPPEPHYEGRIRKEARLDLIRQMRLLVEDGYVLDVETLDRFKATIERGPGKGTDGNENTGRASPGGGDDV